jgi:hypothetical protein
MLLGRRLLLVLMVLTLPAAATYALYIVSLYILDMLHGWVEQTTMQLLAIGEFLLFTFGALLEARSRWSPSH